MVTARADCFSAGREGLTCAQQTSCNLPRSRAGGGSFGGEPDLGEGNSAGIAWLSHLAVVLARCSFRFAGGKTRRRCDDHMLRAEGGLCAFFGFLLFEFCFTNRCFSFCLLQCEDRSVVFVSFFQVS